MYPSPIIMAPWPHPSAKESTLPSPNPVSNNAGSSSSPPSDDFTHDDKETLQSDSFHSEEKPALLKSYTEFEIEKLKSSASVVRKNPNQGSPPRSLMTPSISGHPCGNGEGPHHQNKRKVSSPSPSVSSSPRRARIVTSNNNAGKNSSATTMTQHNHFRSKAYVPNPGYSPPSMTAAATRNEGAPMMPTSPSSVTSSLSATVMDVCKQIKPSGNQQPHRPPRTFYGSNHFNSDCQTGPMHGGRGRIQHFYRGGVHRHGGGAQHSQMPGDHVLRRPRQTQHH